MSIPTAPHHGNSVAGRSVLVGGVRERPVRIFVGGRFLFALSCSDAMVALQEEHDISRSVRRR